MNKIRTWLRTKEAKYGMMGGTVLSAATLALNAGAVDETTTTITTALTTATQQMITDSMAMIGTLVPIVVPLLGASIIVAYGIKFIKRITSKA